MHDGALVHWTLFPLVFVQFRGGDLHLLREQLEQGKECDSAGQRCQTGLRSLPRDDGQGAQGQTVARQPADQARPEVSQVRKESAWPGTIYVIN